MQNSNFWFQTSPASPASSAQPREPSREPGLLLRSDHNHCLGSRAGVMVVFLTKLLSGEMNIFTMMRVRSCSTSLSSGNQVGGLPLACHRNSIDDLPLVTFRYGVFCWLHIGMILDNTNYRNKAIGLLLYEFFTWKSRRRFTARLL